MPGPEIKAIRASAREDKLEVPTIYGAASALRETGPRAGLFA